MADEASHLKTGASWMEGTLATLAPEQSLELKTWTARQFTRLRRGLFAPTQHPDHFARFGIDPRRWRANYGIRRKTDCSLRASATISALSRRRCNAPVLSTLERRARTRRFCELAQRSVKPPPKRQHRDRQCDGP